MKFDFRRTLLLAAVVLLFVGCFFLPNVVAGAWDARKLDHIVTIGAQSISFDAAPELSLSDRITLAASPKMESTTLATGQVMDTDAAKVKIVSELKKFFRDSPFVFKTDGCTIVDCTAVFIINTEDPSINMITWEFSLRDLNSCEVIAIIDDETGVILKLIYKQVSSAAGQAGSAAEESYSSIAEKMYSNALQLVKMMTSYYGQSVGLGDYQHGTDLMYYRADMYSGPSFIPMYGVVRPNGFTMNERV